LFVLACFIDDWVFHHVAAANVYGSDLGKLFRIAGFLPTWFMGAAALVLYDRGREPAPPVGRWHRGLALAAAPILGGLVGEGLKLLIRRERPGLHDGAYVFRSFLDDPWSTRNLGLPSSHAIVAFSGAAMASYIFPRTAPVWLLWAAGCAVTRVLAQAHFTSDVVLAAIAGMLVARTLVVALERRGRTITASRGIS
jgi:membrane-associated phospholipid phosphatase